MADSFSKISAMLESARELTLEAASSASARLMEEAPLRPKDIASQLNGRTDRDKLHGMKNVIGQMAKGQDASEYFADVIKNIASTNLETRKLVYIYLLRYADYEPDLALLSINAIQKSLGDQSPLIRSLALRIMSGIRVPVIAPIVSLAIKQSSNDLSPLVRKTAAHAIGKCYNLDPSNAGIMTEYLEKLLVDKDLAVVAASLATMATITPDRLDLIHPIYRRLVRGLSQLDEWTHIVVIEVLIKYARAYIAQPTHEKLDPDLKELFEAARPLLHSRNGAVVLAAAKMYYYLGTTSTFGEYKVAPPVVRLLRSDNAVQFVALTNIRAMVGSHVQYFVPFVSYFYLFPTDSSRVAQLKLDILTMLCNEGTAKGIISELKYYALTFSTLGKHDLVTHSMISLAKCAVGSPSYHSKVLKWLLEQVSLGEDPVVVSEALSVIRILVQRDLKSQTSTVVRLAKCLLDPSLDIVATAKASILWLVSELCTTPSWTVAVEILRHMLKSFASQEASVRYQIVMLAAKVYAAHLDRKNNQQIDSGDVNIDITLDKMFNYVVHLAKYDPEYDTRDRARVFGTMLREHTELATLILQAPKPCPSLDIHVNKNLILGSSSLAVGHAIDSIAPMPDWTHGDQLVPSSIRDEPVESSVEPEVRMQKGITGFGNTNAQVDHGATAPVKKLTEQTLDEFFSDITPDSKARESEESEETDSSEEDESEDSDDSDDDDSDDDDDDDDEEEDSEESSDDDETTGLVKSIDA